jgi:hypothetical protein
MTTLASKNTAVVVWSSVKNPRYKRVGTCNTTTALRVHGKKEKESKEQREDRQTGPKTGTIATHAACLPGKGWKRNKRAKHTT